MNRLLPLHLACHNGGFHLEVVKALIDAYPKGLEERYVKDHLPLHYACDRTMHIAVEVFSALHKAYPKSINDEDNMRMASHHLRNREGRDSDEDEDILYNEDEELLNNDLIARLMHEATIGGHFLVVKLFVIAFPRSGIVPNEDGMLPLHHGCTNIKYVYIAMVLLDADLERATLTDNLGQTPLQLLMPLAKVKDRKGMLPLHALATRSTILTANFLNLLITAYPDRLYVQDNSGMLPFQYASTNHFLWTSLCILLR